MDELSRALLHGTAGLRSAEEAMDGDLGAALRDQAISEWAADRPVSRPERPWRAGPAPFPRLRLALGVICVLILLAMILIH